MERRVTVFGGSGFVGRYVVKRLAAQGAVVRAAVRDVERAKFLRPMGAVGQVVPFPCDVSNEASIRRAVGDADEVVNLVGILHERGRQRFASIQARAPGLIGEAATQAGVTRLVHVSAIGADPQSKSAYGRTKATGEAALRASFPAATILRPSIVFGPEDAFFNRFAAMARLSPVLPLIHGGRTRFQPVYVGDVAEAVVQALAEPATAGQTYELGGPGIYTFRALLEYMLHEIRRSRMLVPVPTPVARMQAAMAECLPNPPLTRDQIVMLETDNVVAPGMPGLEELGIRPEALEGIVPSYLRRFRPGGGLRRQPA